MSTPASAKNEWRQYWPLPIAAALGYSTSALYTYGLGPFIRPLEQEFGWSRAHISSGLTIAGLTGAFLSVAIGRVIDRVGPRIVGLVGILLMTCCFALLGTATGDNANWFLLWSLIAFSNLWLQATVWTSAVASRFNQSRGMAFGITLAGGSLTAAVTPILASSLIAAFGWRNAFFGVGLIWAAVVFPVCFFLFKGAREGAPKLQAQADASRQDILPGASVSEAVRSLDFAKLLVVSGLCAFTGIAVMVHFIAMLSEHGTQSVNAAAIASLLGVFSIAGRLCTGALLDRFPANRVGASVFLIATLACIILLFDQTGSVGQSLAAILFGFAVGAEVDIVAFMASRRFGLRNYGVLFGAIYGAATLGVATGPLAAGFAYDLFGTYFHFLVLAICCLALSSIAVLTIRQPAPPSQPEPAV